VESGLPSWLLSRKKRSAAVQCSTASPRAIQPRSTATGYADNANPTTAMLIGDQSRELSAYRPLAGLRLRRKRSEEHTSELESLMRISYAVFCLKKKQIR